MQTLKIEDELMNGGTVIRKKATPYLYVISLIIGITLIVMAYIPSIIKDTINLSTALWSIGCLAIIVGIVGIFVPRKYFYDTLTKQRLKQKVYFFHPRDKKKVVDLVQSHNLDELYKLSTSARAGIMVVTYTTSSNKLTAIQIQEYIPFEYVPLNETMLIRQ